MSKNPALVLKQLIQTFKQGANNVEVLKGVSLKLYPGETVALVGPSGAGKSTLLQIAGLLEAPTSGQIQISGIETTGLAEKQRTLLRRNVIGFVYQFHHLLPEFSALENVMLPQLIANLPHKKAKASANTLLSKVSLTHRATHRPSQLSGGEQQRIAIVRALANQPQLLLADEPTGNLDSKTADMVFEELLKLVKEHNVAALIATHNPDLAARMDRTVTLVDGHLH
ncbi:MAG: ABC transporter ATP-binding protein [Alphaproteobacteria bacterium]|nr:ABC transporter ATP-binding protein [Alphaproteobacteria bacterium]